MARIITFVQRVAIKELPSDVTCTCVCVCVNQRAVGEEEEVEEGEGWVSGGDFQSAVIKCLQPL